MLKQYKKNIICISLFMATAALGCSSDKQTFEGRLKYEHSACYASKGTFHADLTNGDSICECCLETADGGKICKPGSEIDCYQSWVCDAPNYTCKECNEGDVKCENDKTYSCLHGIWKEESTNNLCTALKEQELCIFGDCVVGKEYVKKAQVEDEAPAVEQPEYQCRITCENDVLKCYNGAVIAKCNAGCNENENRCLLEELKTNDNTCDPKESPTRCIENSGKYIQQICRGGFWEKFKDCTNNSDNYNNKCSLDAKSCGCWGESSSCDADTKMLKYCNDLGRWEEKECTIGCKDDKSCSCPSKCPDSCDATGKCIGNCQCPNGCNADGSCKCPDTCPNKCDADGKCIDNKCSNGYEVDGSCKCQNCVDEQVCNPGTGDCVDCLENDYMCKSGKIFRCDNNNWNQHNTIQCPNDECRKDDERVQYQKEDNEKDNNVKNELCAAVNANKCADSLGKITILEPEVFPSENLDQCKVCVSEYEASINVKEPTGVDYPKNLVCGNLFEYLNDRNINWIFNSENYIKGCYSFNLDVENKSILVEESGEKQYNGNVDACEFNMDLICSIKMENNYRCYTSTDPGATAPNSIVQQCSGANWTSVFENENRPVLYFYNSTYEIDGNAVDSIHVFSCYDNKQPKVDADIIDNHIESFVNVINGVIDKCDNNNKCTKGPIQMHGTVTEWKKISCFDDVYDLRDGGVTSIKHPILFLTNIANVTSDLNNNVDVTYCPPNYKCNSTHTDCCDKNNTSCLEK